MQPGAKLRRVSRGLYFAASRLHAAQVEYKPFGKPPLKREIQHKWHQFNTSATCATCVHIPAAPAWQRSLPGRATCPALKPRQAAEPPLSPGSLLYALNFNMSEYMSDEHVLGTPGAPPCRATCPASEPCRARAKVGILPPRSGFRLRSTPRLVFRLHFASDFARKILRKRCDGERIASGVGFHPEKPITGPAPKVWERCCPRSIADRVFFHHSHAAVNPGVATGLPLSILAWAQDCSLNPGVGTGLPLQSCCGNRIASTNPVLATGLPRCPSSSSGLELFLPERRLVMESARL